MSQIDASYRPLDEIEATLADLDRAIRTARSRLATLDHDVPREHHAAEAEWTTFKKPALEAKHSAEISRLQRDSQKQIEEAEEAARVWLEEMRASITGKLRQDEQKLADGT